MAIRAVVFDIGGVLEITPDLGVTPQWETRLGLAAGELNERMHDAWRGGSIGTITLDDVHRALRDRLGLDDLGSLAVLPFITLVAGAVWLAATPLRHAQSRRQERAADEFALRLTGGSEAFGSALRRLSARHLVEERPARAVRWLYHRHPTVAERLAAAERYDRRGVD